MSNNDVRFTHETAECEAQIIDRYVYSDGGWGGVYLMGTCSDLCRRICFNLPPNVFESLSNSGSRG